jgi:hypothetical protein
MNVFGPTNIVKILHRKLENSSNVKLTKKIFLGEKLDKLSIAKNWWKFYK